MKLLHRFKDQKHYFNNIERKRYNIEFIKYKDEFYYLYYGELNCSYIDDLQRFTYAFLSINIFKYTNEKHKHTIYNRITVFEFLQLIKEKKISFNGKNNIIIVNDILIKLTVNGFRNVISIIIKILSCLKNEPMLEFIKNLKEIFN